MNNIYIVFGSQTTAMKIHKEITKKLKIDSEILQTPKKFKLRSCTYSIKTDAKNKDIVMDLVKEMNVYVIGIFDNENPITI